MTTLSRRWRAAIVLSLVFVCWGVPFASASDFLSLQRRIIEIYEENRSAMVRVKAVYEANAEEDSPQVFIGSGFFISREGYIITNTNIVKNPIREDLPIRVWVEHESIAYAADVMGVDASTNLAILRLQSLPSTFQFLSLMDQSELPPVGSVVVRLSMPLEFDPTPDIGLVTGHESRFSGRLFPCKYIRTSIPGTPGDGGSAYLDLNGRLLGINVVSVPEVGATYLVPTRAAVRVREDLLSAGEVTRGWIGFEIREETSVRDGSRVVLASITDSPARQAGLLPGDVLHRIGEDPIQRRDDWRKAMFDTRVGQDTQVELFRDGELKEFSVRIAPRPDDEPLEVVRSVPREDVVVPIFREDEPEPGTEEPVASDDE